MPPRSGSVQMSSTAAAMPPSRSTPAWRRRATSALVVAFLLLCTVVKTMPMDIVMTMSEQIGVPAELARLLGTLTLLSKILYMIPQAPLLGAMLLSVPPMRVGSPLLTHALFGLYLGLAVWGGFCLREPRLRALIPIHRC